MKLKVVINKAIALSLEREAIVVFFINGLHKRMNTPNKGTNNNENNIIYKDSCCFCMYLFLI